MIRKKKSLLTIIFTIFLLIFYWMFSLTDFSPGNIVATEKKHIEDHKNKAIRKIKVEIWGKAAISIYLWKHILKGSIESQHNGFINIGNLSVDNFQFHFKNGPGFIQTTVPTSVEYLVLVLNGRSLELVKKSEEWLNYLRNFNYLKKVCVVLLGSEQCENDWILPHMKSSGGVIDCVFLVYDSTLVDDQEFFQWPLGVATYRGFPDFVGNSLDLLNKRPFKANFVGTVYKNSSREVLTKFVQAKGLNDRIRVFGRDEWVANESPESRQQYISALQSSDLTLSPVGMNSECYRIYEAMALGSVPVVEDRITPGHCQHTPPAPLRLLKHMQAPVIWVKNWTQLLDVMEKERSLTFQEITSRRVKVVKWYKNFKHKIGLKFLNALKRHFL